VTIRIIREPSLQGTTLGVVFIDGRFTCFSLEDEIRPVGVKVDGETCIPPGRYRVGLTWSPKFGKVLPEVLDVPGFTGVRIHAGNSAMDTRGCVLLGIQRAGVRILESQKAMALVQAWIAEAEQRAEGVWLLIENPLES
jgi:hypothetical protein